MQLNAYNSPGAESPVPKEVLASAMGAVGILWFLQRRVLRNSTVPAGLALLLGGAAGVAAVIYTSGANKA
jgi:drug/metabolite transporter (DMT)-like permease